MKHRLSILLIYFFAVWSILVLRGLQLQILPGEKLKEASQKQYQRIVRLNSKRGDILDRNGSQLAISVPAYSLFADPQLIDKPRLISLKLSKILPLSQKSIFKKLTKKGSRFVWIDRLLTEEVKNKIAALDERGLGFKDEFRRIYPNKSLLAHVVGFTGADGRGLEGLESRYDSYLRADQKEWNLPKDARGRFLVDDGWLFMQERDGEDIYLTIDADLQFVVEQELKRAIDFHQADAAWAVVLDPRTSEVLAISSQPDYDLNNPTTAPSSNRRNRVLTDLYEPGSTMKTIFMASALKEGIIEPNTLVDTSEGKIEINGLTISESDDNHRFKRLTATEILAFSSNVGVSKLALKMDDEKIYETYKDFGFGEKVGVDLLGESQGLLIKPPWRDHLKANISFGQGIAVTALQVANAYAAIANGGVLNRPYIVKQRRGLEGLVEVNSSRTMRRLLTTKDAEKLKMMLIAATGDHGTGRLARVKGYPVAGKTGTAQKVGPDGRGYIKDTYISSFVGFLPANNPEFLIYVVIDNPKKNSYYASLTAAPVFSRIAEYAVNSRGIAPVQIAETDIVKTIEAEKVIAEKVDEKLIPNMAGWSMREVVRFLQNKDVDATIKGRKGRVVRTTPSEGQEWPEDKKIKIYME
jgi:cell division protein FtsI (penicillin-binding protein 3)